MAKICTIALVVLVTLTLIIGDLHLCNAKVTKTKFKAAVYEHAVILPEMTSKAAVTRAAALRLMKQNLAVFSQQAAEAKRQAVDILVFPEDAVYGMIFTRETVEPFLEHIPDPEVESWIPCDDPTRYLNTEVQYELSCMAKTNHLYIVANIGDWQPCVPELYCPPDNHLQFNTDVAYDPSGQLIARYHKRHLFFEYQFDTPPAKVVSFDTPFGRWGMFTCFDILFYDPAVTSVERDGIANIAFPTAWMDVLPLLASVEFHSAFARRLGVNFLSANIHMPSLRFQGSGIYTPRGQAAFYHNTSVDSEPRLIVSELDVLQKPNPEGQHDEFSTIPTRTGRTTEANLQGDASTDSPGTEDTFQSKLWSNMFTFVQIEQSEGSLRVCSNRLCCYLTYSLTADPEGRDMFAFGVYDGEHTGRGNYYLQICALVRCANQSRQSCGSYTNQSATMFHSLSMRGTFETDYMFPEVLLTTESNYLRLAEAEEWRFDRRELTSSQGFGYPLLAAALFGRDYTRDGEIWTPPRLDKDASGAGASLRFQTQTWLVGFLVSLASALHFAS